MIDIDAHARRHADMIEAYHVEATYDFSFENNSVRVEVLRVLHGPEATYFTNTYARTRSARFEGIENDTGLEVWALLSHHYANGETEDEAVMMALAMLTANLREGRLADAD